MSHGIEQDPDRTEVLATRAPGAAVVDGAALPPGTRIGRYQVVELLGRGGMGEVYRADQLEPVRRTVALKLLRDRRLDARHRAYFEVERQLLAQMRHPAIAQVFDADTTPHGHPYFAMEFIAGSPLTAYCDARALPLDARLRLLIGICEGVQHAHQKGVVHRDLKPGNLLVDDIDGRAVPRIIDFGIATAAGSGAAGEREVAGTPDYMSPEQAAGDQAQVDTRSDVYSLGVVLFELLTGQRPAASGETADGSVHTLRLPSRQVDTLPVAQGEQLARLQGVSRPRMRRLLRHELDWVVARAMAYDRSARYPSASALADDLQRFLDGRPLSAVPASRRYVAGRFVRRHRGALAAASVATIALLAGLAMSVHGLLQARAQQAIAQQRSAQLEAVAAFQQSMLEDIDIAAMGAALATGLRAQLERAGPDASAALEAVLFHASPADLARSLVDGSILAGADAAIASDFGDQPLLAADLAGSVAGVRAALGMRLEAARGFDAIALARERVLGAGHRQALAARHAQARALLDGGDPPAARDVIDAALAHASGLAADEALHLRLRQVDADVLAALGDRPEARRRLEQLQARAASALGEESPEAMEILGSLAVLQTRMGDPAAGMVSMERLASIRARTAGEAAPATLDALHNLAPMRMMTGDAEGAIALQRRIVDLRLRALGAEHPATLASRANLATFLTDAGELEDSLKVGAEVIEAMARVLGPGHRDTLRAKLNRATAYARVGDYSDALALQAEVLDARTRLLGATHPDTVFIAVNRAGTLLQAGRPEAALERISGLLPLAREVLGEGHPQTQAALQIQGEAWTALGRHGEAAATFTRLLESRGETLGKDHHTTLGTAVLLVEALQAAGQRDAADAVHAQLLAPLLAADPAQLAPPLRRLADDLRARPGRA